MKRRERTGKNKETEKIKKRSWALLILRIQRGSRMHKLVGWNYQSQDWSEGRII